MPRDLSLHVVHTSIANFNCICVANFLEGMGVWKGLPNDPQELLAYVGFHIFAEGWIEPCNFSIPNFLPCWFVPSTCLRY